MKKFLAAALSCLSGPVFASMMLSGVSDPPFPYIGAGDLGITFNVYCDLRAYSAIQRDGLTPAVQLRRASDSATQDILLLTSGDIDINGATTFCAATTCTVSICYNQGSAGATHNEIQATAGNQPAFTFNCFNGKPCLRSGAGTTRLSSANNFTPATGVVFQVVTTAFVSGASNGTSQGQNGAGAGNRFLARPSAAAFQMNGASGTLVAASVGAATDWHVGVGIWNGAASILNNNGVETTGTVTGSTAAGLPSCCLGGTTSVYSFTGAGFGDNVVLTPVQRSMLISTTRGYWGF